MFIADKRNGSLSMTAPKKTEGKSYEEFVDEFLDWWLDEVAERRKGGNVEATKS